jgi:hypothetical protein
MPIAGDQSCVGRLFHRSAMAAPRPRSAAFVLAAAFLQPRQVRSRAAQARPSPCSATNRRPDIDILVGSSRRVCLAPYEGAGRADRKARGLTSPPGTIAHDAADQAARRLYKRPAEVRADTETMSHIGQAPGLGGWTEQAYPRRCSEREPSACQASFTPAIHTDQTALSNSAWPALPLA